MSGILTRMDFLLVTIVPKFKVRPDIDEELHELRLLVDAYGGKGVEEIMQRRDASEKGLFIGKGKIEEIGGGLKLKDVDIVVMNTVLSPSQKQFFVEKFIEIDKDIEVWDRVDLILQIFSKHAQTKEARLQIELAQLKHSGHLFKDMGHELSRQSGMTGTRGVGETNTEIETRDLKEQIRRTKKKIDDLEGSRQMLIDRRRRDGMKTVSLIGYTNAGKTSLFNELTGKDKQASDAVFVTLDSSVGALPNKFGANEILISDTIGFIQDLPLSLVDAFRSTLLESIQADLILHVVDVSDPKMGEKITVVNKILRDLKVHTKPRILVFNKVDLVKALDRDALVSKYSFHTPHFVSVKKKAGVGKLIRSLV